MGSLFRSQEMTLVQLFVQAEAAHASVSELGESDIIQFRDLNPGVNAFQRRFVDQIRACDELERILRYFATEMEHSKVAAKEFGYDAIAQRRAGKNEIEDLNVRLHALERELSQLSANDEALRRNRIELYELRHVIQMADKFFGTVGSAVDVTTGLTPTGEEHPHHVPEPALGEEIELNALVPDASNATLGYVMGVLPRSKSAVFERVLWRALRGNVVVTLEELLDADLAAIARPVKGKEPEIRDVFIAVAKGEQILTKARRLCESFGASLYQCPSTAAERQSVLEQIRTRLSDLNEIVKRTGEHRLQLLGQIAEQIEVWTTLIHKEKCVYYALNKFNRDVTSRCLIAEGWVAQARMGELRDALAEATQRSQTNIPTVINVLNTHETPPTYFPTNKFTAAFQLIVEAYGVARYQEVNPTPYTIITFPFLFSVMFGDFGHGCLVTLIAGLIVWKERQLEKYKSDEMFGMIYGGRYIILLMGIFSIYAGLIYNDIFSKVMPIFTSGWDFPANTTTAMTYGTFNGIVYPFGVDYAWHGGDNGLIFLNSYKMKMAVILGILQMSFGLFLSIFNHIHFKKHYQIWMEFIPQVIFLEAIFGYLVICIIYKWCNPWDTSSPPSLLTMLINMFLSPGKIHEGEILYSGQGTVQLILLIVALIAIPWMLLLKPFYLRHLHSKSVAYSALHHNESGVDPEANGSASGAVAESHAAPAAGGHDGHGDHFDFGEIFIHQTIHTIEFCLGAISSTASYLRLWALSLAHAELSEVLWKMTFGNFDKSGLGVQFIGYWVAFSVWFALTLAILCIMEGLSAFLHALRLHWVEFNSKFYLGDGYKFIPFSFRHDFDDSD